MPFVAVLQRCRFVAAVVLAQFALAEMAAAEDDRSGLVWLSGDAIHAAFSGQKLGGIYPNGDLWSETIQANGSTDYREGAKHWLGQWWTTQREFCFSYPAPGVGGCFRVTRISVNCFELYEFSGAAGKSDVPPDIANHWNGRMWHADRPTTCEERPSS